MSDKVSVLYADDGIELAKLPTAFGTCGPLPYFTATEPGGVVRRFNLTTERTSDGHLVYREPPKKTGFQILQEIELERAVSYDAETRRRCAKS